MMACYDEIHCAFLHFHFKHNKIKNNNSNNESCVELLRMFLILSCIINLENQTFESHFFTANKKDQGQGKKGQFVDI